MDIPQDAMLLRIFVGEDDKFRGRPLYEAVVLQAREMHLAGATVLREPMAFGGRAGCIRQKSCASRRTCPW